MSREGSQATAYRRGRGAAGDRGGVERPIIVPRTGGPSSIRSPRATRVRARARVSVGDRDGRARHTGGASSPGTTAVRRANPVHHPSPANTRFGGPEAGGTGLATQLAVSPDGRQVVFVAMLQGVYQLWLRPINSSLAHPLSGTQGSTVPFWSPDSRFIGYFADGKLTRRFVRRASRTWRQLEPRQCDSVRHERQRTESSACLRLWWNPGAASALDTAYGKRPTDGRTSCQTAATSFTTP